MTDPRDTMRWVWRAGALAVLLLGWLFIAWNNGFYLSAPVVFVCLGYLAVVATIYNLWRTGASAVEASDDETDSTWAKPTGALGELEREKRTLMKAIKEADFDLQMGKLSQRDADDMIRTYRARAIEVIKGIDLLGLGSAGSTRAQIMREVKARLELDAKSKKPDAKLAAGGNAGKAKKPTATPEAQSAAAAVDPAVGATIGATIDDSAANGIDHGAKAAAHEPAAGDDAGDDSDDGGADSTTVEPRHQGAAKEAAR